MLEINGKYTKAKVYADIVDDKTLEQVQTLVDQAFMKGVKVAIMPDCHAGKGCVIGTTMTIKDKIVPNLVGVDIGCGMLLVKLGKINIDYKALDKFIKKNIPYGQRVNEDIIVPTSIKLEDFYCYKDLKNLTYLKKSVGSLGNGNHFIEIDVDKDDNKYLIIHSGSRNLGKQVAEIYQNIAVQYHKDKVFNINLEKEKIIHTYKAMNNQKNIQKELDKLKKLSVEPNIPEELCYLEGKDFDHYMHDMNLCQIFATDNRYEMARRIVKFLGYSLRDLEHFETIHNYINMNDKILRKGAISAYKGEIVLIPINMKDGCIIARGKSNKSYNYSAPHGAGRIMSRNQAFKELNVEDYKEAMKGIFSTTINKNTLDEAPFCYKDINSILDNIKDTVDVLEIIKPVYNFKADN